MNPNNQVITKLPFKITLTVAELYQTNLEIFFPRDIQGGINSVTAIG